MAPGVASGVMLGAAPRFAPSRVKSSVAPGAAPTSTVAPSIAPDVVPGALGVAAPSLGSTRPDAGDGPLASAAARESAGPRAGTGRRTGFALDTGVGLDAGAASDMPVLPRAGAASDAGREDGVLVGRVAPDFGVVPAVAPLRTFLSALEGAVLDVEVVVDESAVVEHDPDEERVEAETAAPRATGPGPPLSSSSTSSLGSSVTPVENISMMCKSDI
jgi:hypothetical protein